MSYQVLARKWRPKNFDELVGQTQTSKALTNALESQRLHHAYLFTGTRGVGKTTIARILSKSLNCEKGITSKPCGSCSSCLEIDQGSFVDLMEIDAASKTKVEDTRELLENVQYRPTRGRYKVYLIDEVHMLSGHSFNALLKTLEEPPPHVVFLLATTDPQKLPVTVLSRCLQFHLKRMELAQITSHLSKILVAEEIDFEEEALVPIAKGADGSMRDALSLLDQAIAYSGESIDQKSVLEMLGSIDQSFCFELLDAIHNDDSLELMNIIDKMAQFSPDYFDVMSDWLSMLHQIAVSKATGNVPGEQIKRFAELISSEDLQLFYQLSLLAKKDMPYAPHPKQGFEMAMLRILAFRPKIDIQTNTSSNQLKKKRFESDSVTSEQNLIESAPINSCRSNGSIPDEVNKNLKTTAEALTNTAESIVYSKSRETNVPEAIETEEKGVKSFDKPAIEKEQVAKNESVNTADSENKNGITGCLEGQLSVRKQAANPPEVSSIENQSKEGNQRHEEVSNGQLNSHSVPRFDRENIYPNSEIILLEAIKEENWHVALEQMKINGNGYQVLLNSIGTFDANCLEISHLENVEHFLTDSLVETLNRKIRENFNSIDLKISYISVKSIDETPKQKQNALYESAINGVISYLGENPCIDLLEDKLDAKLVRDTICFK